MAKQRIGYIGVGLMGHGAAKNILLKGYPLTIMGHRHREPVDDLVRQGANEAQTPAGVAKVSDVSGRPASGPATALHLAPSRTQWTWAASVASAWLAFAAPRSASIELAVQSLSCSLSPG